MRRSFRAPAQVDIVITSEGYIGVGLETRARVAQRLAINNLRDGYAAGFEPCEQNLQKFMVFLDLVCQGQLAIETLSLPLIGLWLTKAVAPPDKMRPLSRFGPPGWLKPSCDLARPGLSSVLTFDPWI